MHSLLFLFVQALSQQPHVYCKGQSKECRTWGNQRENICGWRHYLEMTFRSLGTEPGALSLLCAVTGWHGVCKFSSAAVWDSKTKKKKVKKTIKNAAVTPLKKTFCLHCLSPHLHKQQPVRTGPWHPPELRLKKNLNNKIQTTPLPAV